MFEQQAWPSAAYPDAGAVMEARVAIDARVEYGRAGGVQQGVVAIASALAAIERPDPQALTFVTLDGLDDWLRPHLPPGATVRAVESSGARRVARHMRASRPGRLGLSAAVELRNWSARPRSSSGIFESTNSDVALFATQRAELSTIPFVYVPHDLQHRHLPELFRASERHRREVEYRAYCEAAAMIVVFTEWAADDVAGAYGIDPERIVVIPPWAPRADRPVVVSKVSVDHPYALFPAQAWPHKNHASLLEAVSLLRQDGLDVPLVCPGATGDAAAAVRRQAVTLGIGDLVALPGYVDELSMEALWRGARCLVFPSLFEGWGYPVLEAMDAGVPVACSVGRYLDAVAGDAALRFDPIDPCAIADALRTLWLNDAATEVHVARGRAHVATFSWRAMGERYGVVLDRAMASGRRTAAV